MSCKIAPGVIEQVIAFHGHSCPGLAIGIRVAEYALAEFGHSSDEEVVTVSETDMCGVDAIQFLTGCTLGKGNFIHRDYGKNAFSFYRRRDSKAARILLDRTAFADESDESMQHLHMKRQELGQLSPEDDERLETLRAGAIRRIMSAPLERLFKVGTPESIAPRNASILESLECETCGESTMESRTRRFAGKILCLTCFSKVEQKL
jgi:formylmethanofuran dehydrogenase subunit E